jgi:hypothetical protein
VRRVHRLQVGWMFRSWILCELFVARTTASIESEGEMSCRADAYRLPVLGGQAVTARIRKLIERANAVAVNKPRQQEPVSGVTTPAVGEIPVVARFLTNSAPAGVWTIHEADGGFGLLWWEDVIVGREERP